MKSRHLVKAVSCLTNPGQTVLQMNYRDAGRMNVLIFWAIKILLRQNQQESGNYQKAILYTSYFLK